MENYHQISTFSVSLVVVQGDNMVSELIKESDRSP